MKQGTFRVLMVWIDGEEAFADALLEEELLPEQVTALGAAGAARRKGFLLLARRNWELEVQARRVRIPPAVRGLMTLPDGQAVDRLLGWEDSGGRWRPGLAGLEPREALVLRRRAVDRWSIWEIVADLRTSRNAVDKALSEAHRKLRATFGLPEGKMRAGRTGTPNQGSEPAVLTPPATLSTGVA